MSLPLPREYMSNYYLNSTLTSEVDGHLVTTAHWSLDTSCPIGTPIYAVRDGHVLKVDSTDGNDFLLLATRFSGREVVVTYEYLSATEPINIGQGILDVDVEAGDDILVLDGDFTGVFEAGDTISVNELETRTIGSVDVNELTLTAPLTYGYPFDTPVYNGVVVEGQKLGETGDATDILPHLTLGAHYGWAYQEVSSHRQASKTLFPPDILWVRNPPQGETIEPPTESEIKNYREAVGLRGWI